MSDPSRESDPLSDITAVISILKDRQGKSGTAHAGEIYYTILLWLVGRVLMPPYLPRITSHVRAGKPGELQRQLKALSKLYQDNYADHELDGAAATELLESVKSVGDAITAYLPHLHRFLEALPTMGIKNVIIHTDEPMIPWHLAVSDFGDHTDFLCNEFACGTILVEDADRLAQIEEGDAIPRFIAYRKAREQPDLDDLAGRKLCLIAGEIGQAAPGGDDLGLAYVNRLKCRLEKKPGLYKMEIECIQAAEWAETGKNKKDELRRIFERAQIVHFTGHFVDGKMKLAENLLVGAEDLARLPYLYSKPLIVLHGCASSGSAGNEAAQVFRAFLNKGASGCLATVLPVNIPAAFSENAETLIEVFYEKLLKAPWKSYGSALKGSRKQLGGEGSDPQPLFYHFFGDPRETLIKTRSKNVTDYILQSEHDEKKLNLPTRVEFRFPAAGVDENEVLQELNKMDGIQATLRRRMVPMGDPVTAGMLVFGLVGMVFTQQSEGEIKKTLARIKDKIEKILSSRRAPGPSS
jgi:hypothetical protein